MSANLHPAVREAVEECFRELKSIDTGNFAPDEWFMLFRISNFAFSISTLLVIQEAQKLIEQTKKKPPKGATIKLFRLN